MNRASLEDIQALDLYFGIVMGVILGVCGSVIATWLYDIAKGTTTLFGLLLGISFGAIVGTIIVFVYMIRKLSKIAHSAEVKKLMESEKIE